MVSGPEVRGCQVEYNFSSFENLFQSLTYKEKLLTRAEKGWLAGGEEKDIL
jgi:hypothetical protein